ncbi:hypothetical protein LZ32DRAFT_378266 [Colletotrichum eremochloae]|nr:hypothetical protein LZ32DRAFT_378266 [Colletotrichum eremochloae]
MNETRPSSKCSVVFCIYNPGVFVQLGTCSSSSRHRCLHSQPYIRSRKQSSPRPRTRTRAREQTSHKGEPPPPRPFPSIPSIFFHQGLGTLHTQPTCSPGPFCNRLPSFPQKACDPSNPISASVYLIHLAYLFFFSPSFSFTRQLCESARLFLWASTE